MPKQSSNAFQLPGPSNRTTVIGRTGSGKSHLAAWLLSTQNYDEIPWIILDFKDEQKDIINKIDRSIELTLDDELPTRAGIYIIKPSTTDKEVLAEWFQRVFDHRNIGLFIDEVFPIGQHNEQFNMLLMQGRSKDIPIICCTQRPANISVYCFSEASYYFVFDLTKTRDRQTVHHEISAIPVKYVLPKYQSYWYDVAEKVKLDVLPAPKERVILADIDRRIPRYRRTM